MRMFAGRGLIAAAGGLIVAAALSLAALAAPTFPPLTGRVVDNANLLSPQSEATLTARLEGLERESGRQFVVVTLPSLQGYEIEDYGYQLGRAWGLGEAKADNGALLIVAPTERRVRIEVGYGLEPILTDAMSSVILQTQVLPRFKAGQMEAGVVAGANAVADLLALPPGEARAKAVAIGAERQASREDRPNPAIIFAIVLFVVVFLFSRGRRRRSGLGGALPWVVLSALSSSSDRHRGGGWGGGGFGGGGGGFSGGGGSFGGGGSSGSW